jgi:hypothetical protein
MGVPPIAISRPSFPSPASLAAYRGAVHHPPLALAHRHHRVEPKVPMKPKRSNPSAVEGERSSRRAALVQSRMTA